MKSLAHLSNDALLEHLKRLARCERHATAALIAHLAEADARRLYLGEGFSSLFKYCTEVLCLSEHAAYGRILAARAARKYPLVLSMLASGDLNLTSVTLLARHLTAANQAGVLAAACRRSRRQVEELVARLAPRPDVPSTVRELQERAAPAPLSAPSPSSSPAELDPGAAAAPSAANDRPARPQPPARLEPLSPGRYRIQFTAGAATMDKLRQVQDLMRHQIPNGDPAEIFDRALTAMLQQLEKQKFAATSRPRRSRGLRSASRTIPAEVRRNATDRRCAFVAPDGRRCTEQGFLEFDHILPHALGGSASRHNIRLLCRAHNQYTAAQFYGPRVREAEASYPPTSPRLGSNRARPPDGTARTEILEVMST